MRIFMLGWEFPPYISGGLGTACHGLTKGLDQIGVDVCFVLPTAVSEESGESPSSSHVRLRSPADLADLVDLAPPAGDLRTPDSQQGDTESWEHVSFRRIEAALHAYGTPQTAHPGGNDMLQIRRQAQIQALNGAIAKARQGLSSALPPEWRKDKTGQPIPRGTFVMGGAGVNYEGDLMEQIHRYAALAVELSSREDFDVVHAHDWMTYPAGMAVASASGKPLVVHVHSTEFDRAGDNINQQVYNIERAGMHAASAVVCVSYLTRNIVVNRYAVPAGKVHVVYNAVDLPSRGELEMTPIGRDEKIVLFLGRVTMQKGPEYFLQAARKVADRFQKVRFVMAGSGDMIQHCIQLVADLRLGRYVTFTGFLRGGDVERIFRMADLYVMPSVSEPFGIAPLEALSHNVPVIISKQSGVSEVLTHVLKVDFWDTDEMANKTLAVLRHEPLQRTLRQHTHFELTKLSWEDSARRLARIYHALGG